MGLAVSMWLEQNIDRLSQGASSFLSVFHEQNKQRCLGLLVYYVKQIVYATQSYCQMKINVFSYVIFLVLEFKLYGMFLVSDSENQRLIHVTTDSF